MAPRTGRSGLLVSVLDDRPLALEAVARLLETYDEVERVDRMLSPADGLRDALGEPYDCLVLRTARSPSADSETLLRAIRRLRPDLGIVLLLDSPDAEATARGVRAGARAVVSFRSLPDDLLEAVLAVSAGRSYIPGEAVDDAAGYLRDRAEEEAVPARGLAALRLAAQGLTTVEIADRLACSATTVKRVLHETAGRLGARTRAEAVYLARLRGLVDEEGPSV